MISSKSPWSLSHLPDRVLLAELDETVSQHNVSTAALIAHLDEVDERRLYLPAGYESMYEYCVSKLRMSEDVACKRIQVARIAPGFPVDFEALAEACARTGETLALEADASTGSDPAASTALSAPGRIDSSNGSVIAGSAGPAPSPAAARPKLAPLSPGRFELRLTLDQAAHDDLVHLKALLGHTIPSGDLAQVLARALRIAVEQVEMQKLAATTRTRPQRGARGSSSITFKPSHVKARQALATSDFAAGRMINTRPSARSARASCWRSVGKPAAGRKAPGRKQAPGRGITPTHERAH